MCFGTINRCLEGFFRAILKSIQWIFFIVNIGLVIFGLTSFGLFIYTIFWGDGEYQDQLAEELDVDTRTFKALWLVAEVLIGIAELFAWTGCKASGVNLNCLCFKTGKKSVCGLTIYSIFTISSGLALLVISGWVSGQDFATGFDQKLQKLVLPSPADSAFSNSTIEFQQAHECCGISYRTEGVTDTCGQWVENIPFGCDCDPNVDEKCMPSSLATENYSCVLDDSTEGIWSDGCITDMTANFEFIINSFVYGGFLTACALIVSGLVSLLICCAVEDDDDKK